MRILAGLSPRWQFLLGTAVLTVIVLLVVGIYFLAFRSDTEAASEQPIAFNHETHAQNGIQCQFCHSGVDNSPAAGIPSVAFCMECHEHVATDSSEIQKLAGYWERQEPIPWKRVNQQPSYVFFNHQNHIAGGVTCGSCHGDVASMTVAEPVTEMNMGFCLDCHKEQEDKQALTDCLVCHR